MNPSATAMWPAMCTTLILLGGSAQAQSKPPIAPNVALNQMALLPTASFEMGWPDTTVGPYGDAWFVDQQPSHTVTIDEFYLDRTEVSVAWFALFLTHAGGEYYYHPSQPIDRVRDGYLPSVGAENHAIAGVTWRAARDYCRWAGKRLPTEAEFEYAARGVAGRNFPWTEGGPNCERANYFTGATSCLRGVGNVGERASGSTPEGVLDLAGNVAEWVADDYLPYSAEPQSNPRVNIGSPMKVVRGGGFRDSARSLRNHARRALRADRRSDNVGFRCAYREGDTLDAPRGVLSAPEDIEREVIAAPSKSAANPIMLAEGLLRPQCLTYHQGGWVVCDTGHGQLVSLGEAGEAVDVLATDLQAPTVAVSAAGELLVATLEDSTVWSITDTGQVALTTLPSKPQAAVSTETDVYFATSNSIYRRTANGFNIVVDGVDGVGGLTVRNEKLYYSELGTNSSSNARVVRSDLDGSGATALVTQDVLQGALHATALTFDSAGRLVFPLSRVGWPYAGPLAVVQPSNGSLQVGTHMPPRISALVSLDKGGVVAATQRGVVLVGEQLGSPYQVLGGWSSPSAVGVSPTGDIVWTDGQSGAVWMVLSP